jgi:hypothetical protein
MQVRWVYVHMIEEYARQQWPRRPAAGTHRRCQGRLNQQLRGHRERERHRAIPHAGWTRECSHIAPRPHLVSRNGSEM